MLDQHRRLIGEVVFELQLKSRIEKSGRWSTAILRNVVRPSLSGLAVFLPIVDTIDELPRKPQPVVPWVIWRRSPSQRLSSGQIQRMKVRFC